MKSTQIMFINGKQVTIERTVTTNPDGTSNIEVKEYGIGNIRSFKNYETYSEINFSSKNISKKIQPV